MKKFLLIAISLASLSCASTIVSANQTITSIQTLAASSSCGRADPMDSPGFCSTFKSVAYCRCRESGGSQSGCNSMDKVYKAMVSFWGSVERACSKGQSDVSAQECIDNWNHYRNFCKD